MGADVIEPDLVMTRDGVLIARHENEIGGTTDVAEKFPARKTTKQIEGAAVTGWFTEDFTLAEIQTLRAKERLAFRSHEYDGKFLVPTFAQVLDLAQRRSRETGREIGVYPETKHPAYFRGIGLPLEEPLLALLKAHGLTTADVARVHPIVRSCEPAADAPADPGAARAAARCRGGRVRSQARRDRTYADGVGLNKNLVIPVSADGRALPALSVVHDAHAGAPVRARVDDEKGAVIPARQL